MNSRASSTRVEGARWAVSLVRQAVQEGPNSLAHQLAFGTVHGPAHMDVPGIANVWLCPRTIANIQTNELRKLGIKIGTRPARSTTSI